MSQIKFGSILLMATILAGCGGGDSDVPAKPKFAAQVSFGDSLSDVGTYNVGFVAAAGGGHFSINGASANGKAANGNNIVNWTEVVAMNLGLPAPCAAVTGLIDTAGAEALSVPVVSHPGCNGYAQGGALVTNPYGVHNTHYGTYGAASGLGGAELTYPVVTQINNYLADHGGSFSGNELVSVVVGANEVTLQLTLLVGGAKAAATAAVTAAVPAQIQADILAGTCIPANPQASNCVSTAVAELTPTVGAAAANTYLSPTGPAVAAAVTAMATAASDLVNNVNTLILAKGAKYVLVASIPDLADIPALAAYSAAQKSLVDAMVITFNSTLKAGLTALPGNANVIYLDTYTSIKDEITNPAKYLLTNTKAQACDPALTPQNRALLCNASTLIAGQTADSHYLFADDQHPTPYGYLLFATYVLQQMTTKGWY
ncbi:putative lipase / esterase protein [Rhodoferax ferrireducens T118]|uniref:Putative lipase / esterase protein n=1 Tax=Albidiferax ferrireducens (strain ATCC BAA-621 / DSM 15236 / T118) TaxID=338969 RepID=Q21UY3_ALBFT|nr:SGNH/GDSL hydrolase family protein [Rhodoferax ferrireducens]ABD70420.1 putative lipase / esterase protein [Rhodoferax ferrireducens T118]